MAVDAVDLAGAVVGVVERGEELGPHRVTPGDAVIALASPNLRSNGFSLVRSLFAGDTGRHLDELLDRSVIYSPAVLRAVGTGAVHAAAHITGGGLAANLQRALPEGLGAGIDTGSWSPPPVFDLVASHGVTVEEMFQTFNMGVGFCLVVDAGEVETVLSETAEHHAWRIGSVVEGGQVVLT
jgi:phosphoribosylformylglycinamidine cyclo-ligase